MGQEHSQIAQRTRDALRATPAYLMRKHAAESPRREDRVHHIGSQADLVARLGNEMPQHEIIGEMIANGGETANGLQHGLGGRHRSAQREVHPLQQPGRQHARHKFGGDAQGFQRRRPVRCVCRFI